MTVKTEKGIAEISEALGGLIDALEGVKSDMEYALDEEREKDEESIDEGVVDKLEEDLGVVESALAFLENGQDELTSLVKAPE